MLRSDLFSNYLIIIHSLLDWRSRTSWTCLLLTREVPFDRTATPLICASIYNVWFKWQFGLLHIEFGNIVLIVRSVNVILSLYLDFLFLFYRTLALSKITCNFTLNVRFGFRNLKHFLACGFRVLFLFLITLLPLITTSVWYWSRPWRNFILIYFQLTFQFGFRLLFALLTFNIRNYNRLIANLAFTIRLGIIFIFALVIVATATSATPTPPVTWFILAVCYIMLNKASKNLGEVAFNNTVYNSEHSYKNRNKND